MQNAAHLSFSIDALNRASDSQAAAMMDRIVERAAWLARRAAEARPFRDAADLARWLETEVRSLSRDDAVQLLCAHPELSPPEPLTMTTASQVEQARLGLLDPDTSIAGHLSDLNRQYLRRYGYPCIIALHAHRDLAGVIAEFERRIAADDADRELDHSLAQVVSVMNDRLRRLTGAMGESPAPARPEVIMSGGAKQ